MRTLKIHLIRHGATDANVLGQYIGCKTDTPLSPEGLNELRLLKENMEYPEIDCLYSSPMLRCKQTAAVLYPEKETVSVDNLREYDFGSFEGKTAAELENITAREALKHPNWSMGAKITIDSATLMNKGLEVIEAVHLFGLPAKDIEVLVHRQSIVHSGVEFSDGAVIAQLGTPDMRLPIQYALTWPERTPGCAPKLDFNTLRSITFDQPDEETFRCLPACKKALQKGGLATCAANGANEAAVALFLQDKIPFLRIGELVEQIVEDTPVCDSYTLQDVFACDKQARAYVQERV